MDEYSDPEHGQRGAALAEAMSGDAYEIEPSRLDLLKDACERHDRGETTADASVGCCWDADRLNLWRVGIRPVKTFLSPTEGEGLIDEARDYHGGGYKWDSLIEQYQTLSSNA